MATHPTDIAAQNITLAQATRIHSHWTQSELNRLQALRAAGARHRDVALQLHRSLYGVRSAARVTAERRTRQVFTRTVPMPASRFVGTTLADMGF